MAVGACIQNMLLAAHSLGLGACWQGEVLNKEKDVKNILGVPESLELMAVVTMGYPAGKEVKSKRKKLEEVAHRERW